jgi:putative transposase
LLSDAIKGVHERSRGTYGVLRIRAALEIEQGIIVNTKLVLKLMRQLGIHGLPGPKKGKRNLVNAATQEDLVKRNFTSPQVNALWLTDITEHHQRGHALLLRGSGSLFAPDRGLGDRSTL